MSSGQSASTMAILNIANPATMSWRRRRSTATYNLFHYTLPKLEIEVGRRGP